LRFQNIAKRDNGNHNINEMIEPSLTDFYNPIDNDIDGLLSFIIASIEYDNFIENEENDNERVAKRLKIPYRPRFYGTRKNWKDSIWYKDYVLDVDGKFNNPNNRNGKLFRCRFSLDFEHISHVADKMIL
jgi:hypothetical protein